MSIPILIILKQFEICYEKLRLWRLLCLRKNGRKSATSMPGHTSRKCASLVSETINEIFTKARISRDQD